MDHLFSEEPFISECLPEAAILGIQTTADASFIQITTTKQQTIHWELPTLPLFTVRGRKGLLFEGKKFTLKFQWKCGISSWPCSTGNSCKAIASVEVKDNDSHIIEISDHNKSLLLKLLTYVPLSSHIEIDNNLAASCY